MKWEDVTLLTQKALAQSMDKTYMEQLGDISALPIEKLVDVGKDVTDMENTVEKFTKALVSVIAYYEFMQVNIREEFDDLFVKSEEWGGFIERIYYGLATVIDDPMYNTVNGNSYSEIEHKFYQPEVSAKVFNEAKACMVPISIQRDTLQEAFRGPNELNSYISGIHAMVSNTIKMVRKAYGRMAVAAGIAISEKATNTSVHLLTEAKAAGIVEQDMTAEKALQNPNFLAYACKRISEIKDYITVESTAFNNGSVLASANEVKTYLLNEFERSVRFNLRADTYNPEDRSLGDYKTVTSWQGVASSGNKFDFASLSKIMIAADADNKLGLGVDAVTVDNVIGVAFDSRAIGCCLSKTKITSNYTACADFWNEFTHILTNWIVDTNLPIVAFIVD